MLGRLIDPAVRNRELCAVLRHVPLRHRLRRQPRRAEEPSTAAPVGPLGTALLINLGLLGAVRGAAQRDGAPGVQALVDAHRAGAGRAQHLRAGCRSLALIAAVLAVAADRRRGVERRRRRSARGAAARRCSRSAGLLVLVTTFLINHFDLFGLRQVWLHLRGRALPAAALRDARSVPLRAAPALRRLADRLLGDADDDRRRTCCSRS